MSADYNTTRVAASSTGAAQANNCTLAAPGGKANYVAGFAITGAGATAASVIDVTLTGLLGGTQTYKLPIPAGAAVGIVPLVVAFNPPLVASGPSVAVALNVPSFGAGNLHAAAVLYGVST